MPLPQFALVQLCGLFGLQLLTILAGHLGALASIPALTAPSSRILELHSLFYSFSSRSVPFEVQSVTQELISVLKIGIKGPIVANGHATRGGQDYLVHSRPLDPTEADVAL